MAFLPVPITVLVLILKAAQDKGIAHPSPVLVDEEDLEEKGRGEESRVAGTEKGTAPSRIKGEPTTGFGPTPVSEREIIVTALFIIVPSLLLTWEQGIRTAQAFYRPAPGQPQPWVSPFHVPTFIGLDCLLTVPLQYMSKATFWVSIFAVEWIAVLILGFAVLPRRFSHLKLV
jgi:hypothetical protein